MSHAGTLAAVLTSSACLSDGGLLDAGESSVGNGDVSTDTGAAERELDGAACSSDAECPSGLCLDTCVAAFELPHCGQTFTFHARLDYTEHAIDEIVPQVLGSGGGTALADVDNDGADELIDVYHGQNDRTMNLGALDTESVALTSLDIDSRAPTIEILPFHRNDDGRLDLLVGDRLWYGEGDGRFYPSTTEAFEFGDATKLVAHFGAPSSPFDDFVALVEGEHPSSSVRELWAVFNRGAEFEQRMLAAEVHQGQVVVGDFAGDGRDRLAFVSAHKLRFAEFGDHEHIGSLPTDYPTARISSLTARADGLGQERLTSFARPPGRLLISTWTGDGWDHVIVHTTGSIVMGDFDGDGDDDLLLLERDSPAGPFLASSLVVADGPRWRCQACVAPLGFGYYKHATVARLLTGDLDGNGTDEIVATGALAPFVAAELMPD